MLKIKVFQSFEVEELNKEVENFIKDKDVVDIEHKQEKMIRKDFSCCGFTVLKEWEEIKHTIIIKYIVGGKE